MPSAAKVGLLIVVFMVLFITGFAVLGRNLLGGRSDDYYADFADAGGVAQGTPVHIAGVQVGIVHRVKLASPNLAQMTLRLDKGTKVPEGSTAVIPSSLIGLGENPVQIVPPKLARGTYTYLEPGSLLKGRRGSPFDTLLPEGTKAVEDVTKTIAAFRRYLEDDRLRNGIVRVVRSSDRTVQQVGKLASSMNDLLESNRGELRRAAANASATLGEVRRTAAAVARLAEDPRLRKNAVGILEGLQRTTRRTEQLVASVTRLVEDPRLREPLARTAASVARLAQTAEGAATSLAQKAESIAANAEVMSASGVRIAKDAERIASSGAIIAEESTGLPKRLDDVLVKAAAVEDQVQKLLERVNALLPAPRKGGGGGKSLTAGLETEADLLYETDPGHFRTDLSLRYPLSKGALHFGIYDAFESNKLTLQYGSPLTSPFGYRYGIYAGKPGLGVDFRAAPRVGLRGDLWDLNNLRLDLRARFDFGGGFVGWVGLDRVFKDNAPTIGIGIRR